MSRKKKEKKKAWPKRRRRGLEMRIGAGRDYPIHRRYCCFLYTVVSKLWLHPLLDKVHQSYIRYIHMTSTSCITPYFTLPYLTLPCLTLPNLPILPYTLVQTRSKSVPTKLSLSPALSLFLYPHPYSLSPSLSSSPSLFLIPSSQSLRRQTAHVI